MLDSAINDQLKSVFGKLEGTVDFVYEPSQHADQAQLVEFLNDVAQTSSKLTAREGKG
ncbi:MAG: alkyl hydroperoxide reductase subunit F, partial [Proteobacteria bacterium]